MRPLDEPSPGHADHARVRRAAGAIAEAVRADFSGALRLRTRLLPSAFAVACFGATLYLLAHRIIGLRTWAW